MLLYGARWLKYLRRTKIMRPTHGNHPSGSLHLPRTFVFPGPYTITVRLLAPMEMKAKYGEFYDIMWDREAQRIDVARRAKIQRKWWLVAQVIRSDVIDAWLEWMEVHGIAHQHGLRPPWKTPSVRKPPKAGSAIRRD